MKQSSTPSDLPPKHVRAARALLAWSQQDLARQAGVATSTVADFERGHRTLVTNNAQAIRSALETADIRFLPTGAVIGPPIPRIPSSERPNTPIRWVTAKDLSDWAGRLDGAASLPTLLARLLRATHGSAISIRFPSDEGIYHSGWDGWTVAEKESRYVPQGTAGWEFSTQRDKIATKATSVYTRRTANPGHIDPANSTFIFITLGHWPGKDKWAKKRRDAGPWRDVRVYDADDLVHWIEQAPAAGLWLARRLDKRPPGTRELEEIWEEWSLATRWPLTENLVLSDRDEDAAVVLRWLRGEPSVLSIQATTTDEAAAFFHAVLGMLPGEVTDHYRARCLVAANGDAARALMNAQAPLILVLTEPNPGLANRLPARGHFVLQVYDDRPIGSGEIRKLARPSREGIAAALTDAGIPEPRAQALARDCARNLAVLRRLIPSAPGSLPRWALMPPPRALLAAILAGGWDETSEPDKATLVALAGEPYDQMVGALRPYVDEFDRPLRKVGTTWRIASRQDAWLLLAQHLTGADIERFEAAALAVLGSLDPRHDMDAEERRITALYRGRARQVGYSGLLRHGIGEVLILLALSGDKVRTLPAAEKRAGGIVRKLLQNADQRQWRSLSRDFRLLAEASPEAFLGAVEDSLYQNDPPIRILLGTDNDGVFGAKHLAELLWALKTLAWSPRLLPRVSLVLARLDAIDQPGGRYANRPGNSLRDIHWLWLPQTFASLDDRLRTLDQIRQQENASAWKLMLAMLPRGHDWASGTATPLWRDFTVDEPEVVTRALLERGIAETSTRLLVDVRQYVPRWLSLLDHIMDLANPDAAISQLEAAEVEIRGKSDRASLRAGLRKLLRRHRRLAHDDGSLKANQLDRIEALYERLSPPDMIERICWLFEQGAELPNPSREGWHAEERQLDEARRQAARDVHESHGIRGIFSLAHAVSTPGFIGKALFEDGLDDAGFDALLAASLRSDVAQERDVGHGLILSAFGQRKEPWAEQLILKARKEDWGDAALLTILKALPAQRWTWDQAAQAGAGIEDAYWRWVPTIWIGGADVVEIAYAMKKLIAAGRARHAVHLAGHEHQGQLPSALLTEALTEALGQPFEESRDSNEPKMFEYHVVELLSLLDGRTDVSAQALADLEWGYLPILRYSRRQPTTLLKALAAQPAFFIQVVSALFKPSEASGVVEPESENPQRAEAVAAQAHRLLQAWDRLPGARDDGTIDTNALEAWVKEARSLARAAGREDQADKLIGTMLSASPDGSDGIWPAEAVRDVIDLFRSKRMIEGFRIGKRNRRGVTTRLPRDGGELERREAAKYRQHAAAIAYEHPHTAKVLDTLADAYEEEARRHDEEAERLDWEP